MVLARFGLWMQSPGYLGHSLFEEPKWSKDLTPAAVFVGAMLGMLWMGRLGDTLGRTRALQAMHRGHWDSEVWEQILQVIESLIDG